MAERRIIKGWIYEKRADGSIVPIAPADQMPMDPTYPTKGPKAEVDLQGGQLDNTGQAIDNRKAAATLPYDVRKAAADATKAEAEAVNAGKPKPPTDEEQKAKVRSATMESIVGQINEVTRLYKQGIRDENFWNLFGALDSFGPEAGRFDSAGQGMADQGLAAFRVPGQGSQSDYEARQFAMANTPQAGDWDAAIEQKLTNLRRRVDANRAVFGLPAAQWEGVQDEPKRSNAAASLIGNNPVNGSPPGSPGSNAGGGGVAPLTPAGGESYSTPNDVAAAQAIQSAYNGGASVPQMLEVARRFGFQPGMQDVSEWQRAIDYRDGTGEYKGQRRGLAQVTTPVSGRRNLAEQALGKFASSPAGALGIGAADTATFGGIDEVVGGVNTLLGKGDYEAVRDYADFGKRAAMEENPGWAIAGNVLGGIAPGMAMEGMLASGLSRLSPQMLSRARSVLNNPLAGPALEGGTFGALYGAGSSNNDRAGGALRGAVGGTVGGVAGAGATRAVSRAVGGVGDEAVRRLTQRGVSLTPGQIGATGGMIGRTMKRMEDAAESIPGLSSIIRARRTDSFNDFNREALNEALQPIGATVGNIAEEGVEEAQDAVAQGYRRALDGVSISPDAQFGADIGNAVNAGRANTQFGDDFSTIIDGEIVPLVRGQQTLSGDNLQDILRIARGYARQYRDLGTRGANGIPQPQARPVADAFDLIGGSLEGLANRNAPEVMPAYNAANQAYRNVGIVRDAVDAAKAGTQTGEGGVFTPFQLEQAASRNAKKFGGAQGTTRQPFYQITRDAQATLPSSVPNSGTADRAIAASVMAAPALAAGGLSAADVIDPKTAMSIAALSAAYSRAGQSLIQRGLVSRPEPLVRAGETIADYARRGGQIGSLLAAPAALYPTH